MRELLWGLPMVAREVRAWRVRALAISDPSLRWEALAALADKRCNADGAALFSILTPRRDARLVRLLVAYEIMSDFLDSINERSACVGLANGCQLHLALVEAVDLSTNVSDYYRYHPSSDDTAYLSRLVEVCREGCRWLPSYASVHPLLIQAATLAQVQGLNHEFDPALRQQVLKDWAGHKLSGRSELSWFEFVGAASAWLTVLVLLALAAKPGCGMDDGAEVYAAYFPWVSLTATMLDSYADVSEDAQTGSYNCLAYYPTAECSLRRVEECVRRAVDAVTMLRHSSRHAVILACMIAMYLSKDSARAPEVRATTKSFAPAGGSLTRLLLPILRLWRIAFSQQSA